jgi:hypothetical protein
MAEQKALDTTYPSVVTEVSTLAQKVDSTTAHSLKLFFPELFQIRIVYVQRNRDFKVTLHIYNA